MFVQRSYPLHCRRTPPVNSPGNVRRAIANGTVKGVRLIVKNDSLLNYN